MPGDSARVAVLHPCALCGGATNREVIPTPAPLSRLPGLFACQDHERILREAMQGESLSTVISRRNDGGSLAVRAYGKPHRVMLVVCSTAPGDPTQTSTAMFNPREARRLATALVRAARVAEGRPETDVARA